MLIPSSLVFICLRRVIETLSDFAIFHNFTEAIFDFFVTFTYIITEQQVKVNPVYNS